jgi:predicted RNase H-like nuclease (RuvC/YqgF family)
MDPTIAFQGLAQHGLAGAVIILCVLAIVALNRRLDNVSDKRLAETREALTTISQVNTTLAAVRDAVTGLSTSNASLVATVQTMQAEWRAANVDSRAVRERLERELEETRKDVRGLHDAINGINVNLSNLSRQSDRSHPAGR